MDVEVNGVKLELAELSTTWKWSLPVGSGGNLAIPSKKKLNHKNWWEAKPETKSSVAPLSI